MMQTKFFIFLMSVIFRDKNKRKKINGGDLFGRIFAHFFGRLLFIFLDRETMRGKGGEEAGKMRGNI